MHKIIITILFFLKVESLFASQAGISSASTASVVVVGADISPSACCASPSRGQDFSVTPHISTGGVKAVCDDRISSQALQKESSKIKSNDFCCGCVVQ